MAKSQQSFNKKEREKKRQKKRKEKLKRKDERKENKETGKLDDMIAYVDEAGNITDTPPDPNQKRKVNAKEIEISVPKLDKSQRGDNYEGKVSFFDESKGYGFINDSNSPNQYFVHKSRLIDFIQENDKVTFKLERGLKGMNAIDVKKI